MGRGVKALLQLPNFTLGPDATLNTEIHNNSVRIKAPNSVKVSSIIVQSESRLLTNIALDLRIRFAGPKARYSNWYPVSWRR